MGGEGLAGEGELLPVKASVCASGLGRVGPHPWLLSLWCHPQVPAELICLDPRALAEVDVISLEQEKKERIERLVWSRPPAPRASHSHFLVPPWPAPGRVVRGGVFPASSLTLALLGISLLSP